MLPEAFSFSIKPVVEFGIAISSVQVKGSGP